MLPLLKMSGDGQPHTLSEAIDHLAREFRLTEEDRNELLKSGQTRLYNRVGWTTTYLKKAGLLRAVGPGRYQITDRGQEVLGGNPAEIDVAFLESRFPEMSEFRKSRTAAASEVEEAPAVFSSDDRSWNERVGVSDRVRLTLERSIANEGIRRAALKFFALAIENADEESGNSWYVRETEHGLRLMTGRLLACEIARSSLRVSVIGPVSEEVREVTGAEASRDEEFKFKTVAGGILLTFPAEHAEKALELLMAGLNAFVDVAIGRVRSPVSLEDHAPEAVRYIGSVVGRDLPQPEPLTADGFDDADDETDEVGEASREPRTRGRAPIFEYGQRSIASLMDDIEREVIALPDLQRPFVWEDTKVRDLLDSLFLGFPVGTLVLWHTNGDRDARAIGAANAGLGAAALIIDGQQRLTSLYAVIGGADVVGKDGAARRVTIAFRPRDGRFEVADAAIRNDPEFIPNVTELWNGSRTKPQIQRELVNALRDKGRAVGDEYADAVAHNLDRAHAIGEYRVPTVEIRRTTTSQDAEATEEDVAEIFVRINNQGTRLGQADFVLTLLSVFHGDLRDRIEERARAMSAGTVVEIDTQQLLRAACAVAFGRARMSAVYRYLRGVDPTTGAADAAGRARRLQLLDEAANECMQPTLWRDYLLRVKHAGFVNQGLVASRNALVNGYAFYVRGRREGVPKDKLDEVIARWVFASLLSARYSRSSETTFEADLTRLAELQGDTDGFVRILDEAMAETITGDYWTHSLVSALETQKARSPAALAFRAAQIVLGTRALFSSQMLHDLLNPPAQGTRAASEAHHLFPVAWLHGRGVRDRRLVNQVANLADVGWHENSVIGGHGPAEYVPRLRERLGIDDGKWGRFCAEHALPPRWESMDYEEFLRERRRRMADIIRVAFRQLGGERDAAPLAPPWFLPGAEQVWQRIVETERGLRGVVRLVYGECFGEAAPKRNEEVLSEAERESHARRLRARPVGADAMSVVDYLYLGQLPSLLFAGDIWPKAKRYFGANSDAKSSVQSALNQIAPVRNEIAHVREVEKERLLRASAACGEVLEMIQDRKSQAA